MKLTRLFTILAIIMFVSGSVLTPTSDVFAAEPEKTKEKKGKEGAEEPECD